MDLVAGLIERDQNVSEALPFLFQLGPRKPFSLKDYAPFRILYKKQLPDMRVIKAGRQVAKTTNICIDDIMINAVHPGFTRVYASPLHQQTHRYSVLFLDPILNFSPIRARLMNVQCTDRVLMKTCINGSSFNMSYCSNGADRIRGIPCDGITLDEFQDLYIDDIPVIREAMSGSPFRIMKVTGTPKTVDNTLEEYFRKSSQAHWAIQCHSCNHENIATVEEDLLGMIQTKGLCCAKWHRGIQARDGYWLHKHPERVNTCLGIHIPQPILPLHCEDPRRWKELLDKVNGDYTKTKLYNECLGESCDTGVKIISTEQIKAVSVLHCNILEDAIKARMATRYKMVTMGIDWGGHGEKESSFTAVAICGFKANGKIDIIYAERLPIDMSNDDEFSRVFDLVRAFKVNMIGHDYRGVGTQKHSALLQGAPKGMFIVPWTNETSRAHYFLKISRTPNGITVLHINRTASIELLAHEIRAKNFRLPAWDSGIEGNVFADLNSWYANMVKRPDGSKVFHIMRSSSQPDDVGMAILYGCFTIWRRLTAWPKYSLGLTEKHIINEAEDD